MYREESQVFQCDFSKANVLLQQYAICALDISFLLSGLDWEHDYLFCLPPRS